MPQLNVLAIAVPSRLFACLFTLLLVGGIGLPLASVTAAETADSASSAQLSNEELAVRAETLRQTQPQLFAGATGILVTEVIPHSQAVTAGLARGDILLGYAGHPINSIEDLISLVQQQTADTEVSLAFLRNGESLTRTLRRAGWPGPPWPDRTPNVPRQAQGNHGVKNRTGSTVAVSLLIREPNVPGHRHL